MGCSSSEEKQNKVVPSPNKQRRPSQIQYALTQQEIDFGISRAYRLGIKLQGLSGKLELGIFFKRAHIYESIPYTLVKNNGKPDFNTLILAESSIPESVRYDDCLLLRVFQDDKEEKVCLGQCRVGSFDKLKMVKAPIAFQSPSDPSKNIGKLSCYRVERLFNTTPMVLYTPRPFVYARHLNQDSALYDSKFEDDSSVSIVFKIQNLPNPCNFHLRISTLDKSDLEMSPEDEWQSFLDRQLVKDPNATSRRGSKDSSIPLLANNNASSRRGSKDSHLSTPIRSFRSALSPGTAQSTPSAPVGEIKEGDLIVEEVTPHQDTSSSSSSTAAAASASLAPSSSSSSTAAAASLAPSSSSSSSPPPPTSTTSTPDVITDSAKKGNRPLLMVTDSLKFPSQADDNTTNGTQSTKRRLSFLSIASAVSSLGRNKNRRHSVSGLNKKKWNLLYMSDVAEECTSHTFEPIFFPVSSLCQGGLHIPFRIDLVTTHNVNKHSESAKVMASASLTVASLLGRAANKKRHGSVFMHGLKQRNVCSLRMSRADHFSSLETYTTESAEILPECYESKAAEKLHKANRSRRNSADPEQKKKRYSTADWTAQLGLEGIRAKLSSAGGLDLGSKKKKKKNKKGRRSSLPSDFLSEFGFDSSEDSGRRYSTGHVSAKKTKTKRKKNKKKKRKTSSSFLSDE